MRGRKFAADMAARHMECAWDETRTPEAREAHRSAAILLDGYAKTGDGKEAARAVAEEADRLDEEQAEAHRRAEEEGRRVQRVALIRADAELAQQKQLRPIPTNPLGIAFARADAALAQLAALHEADEEKALSPGDLDHARHLTSWQRSCFGLQEAEEAADVIEGYVREAEFWLAPRGGEG